MNTYVRFLLSFFASMVLVKLFLDFIENEFVISFVLGLLIAILYIKDDQ